MVGVDKVGRNKVYFVLSEQELVRYHVGGDLLGPGEVSVSAEIAVGVGRFEFEPDILAAVVIEAVQHIGRAELAVVEQVAGLLVVTVDADLEARDRVDLLDDADVEHVGAFRQHRTVERHLGSLRVCGNGGGRNQREIGRRRNHLLRRREVSRIAGVEGGAVVRLPGQAEARAQLVGIDILIHLVEAQSGVQGQVVVDLPLVLKVRAKQPAGFAALIERSRMAHRSCPGQDRSGSASGNTVDILLTRERSALTENPNRSVWAKPTRHAVSS